MLVGREIEELAGQLEQPAVLNRVAQRFDSRDEPADFFLGIEIPALRFRPVGIPAEWINSV